MQNVEMFCFCFENDEQEISNSQNFFFGKPNLFVSSATFIATTTSNLIFYHYHRQKLSFKLEALEMTL
jgi:hypothetical protein